MAQSRRHVPPKTWFELLTPQALSQYGHLPPTAPTGEFDPEGEWTQCWQIYLLRKTTWEKPHAGHVEITRRPETGRVRFKIRQANIQGPQLSKTPIEGHDCQNGVWLSSVCDTQADLVCRDDRFATPESWTLATAMRCTKGKDFQGTRLTKQMRIRGGRIELSCNGRTSTRSLPGGDVTSNWGLLNVLSTIDARDAVAFTVLDELDKAKAGHKLYHAADMQITFGGEDVNVHCYHQIGRGCLPWEYYVDVSTRRVLLAISGLRAYILDDGAAERTETQFPGFVDAGRMQS